MLLVQGVLSAIGRGRSWGWVWRQWLFRATTQQLEGSHCIKTKRWALERSNIKGRADRSTAEDAGSKGVAVGVTRNLKIPVDRLGPVSAPRLRTPIRESLVSQRRKIEQQLKPVEMVLFQMQESKWGFTACMSRSSAGSPAAIDRPSPRHGAGRRAAPQQDAPQSAPAQRASSLYQQGETVHFETCPCYILSLVQEDTP